MARHEPREYQFDDLQAVARRLPPMASDWDTLVSQPAALGRDSGFSITTSPWDDTVPAALEPLAQPEPFREAMRGLEMREVREPEVFRLFFGHMRAR